MLERKERRVKNIRTYYLSDSDLGLQTKIDDLARRERVSLSAVVIDALSEYHKKHGDGNPSYTLDHYQDDDFLVTPALCRPAKKWERYLSQASNTTKEEIKQQIILIDHILGRHL